MFVSEAVGYQTQLDGVTSTEALVTIAGPMPGAKRLQE